MAAESAEAHLCWRAALIRPISLQTCSRQKAAPRRPRMHVFRLSLSLACLVCARLCVIYFCGDKSIFLALKKKKKRKLKSNCVSAGECYQHVKCLLASCVSLQSTPRETCRWRRWSPNSGPPAVHVAQTGSASWTTPCGYMLKTD